MALGNGLEKLAFAGELACVFGEHMPSYSCGKQVAMAQRTAVGELLSM
jgi:hypothetical protein